MSLSFSHSAIDTLNRCHRAYKFTYLERRQRIGDRAALRRGKHFADSLERDSFADSKTWYLQQIDKGDSQERIDELWFEMLVLEGLVDMYRNWHEPCTEREVAFDNPIDGMPDARNKGRIDGVIRTDAGLLLVEDKLKMMWKRAEELALPLNRQINRYIVEYGKAQPEPIIGVQYRVTKYPSAKPRKGERIPDAVERILKSKSKREWFLDFHVEPNVEGREIYEESMRSAVSTIQQNMENDTWLASGSALACSEPYPCDFLNRCMNEFGWEWEYEERTYD